MHRKNWTPPDLPEQRSVPDRILQYAARDYVLGQSSQDMLQSIAFRLNSGHNPMEMGELDRSELEAEVTEESRQRSAPAELDSHPVYEIGAYNHDRLPVYEIGSYNDDRLPQWAKRSPFGAERQATHLVQSMRRKIWTLCPVPLVGWEERIGAGREVSFSRESLKRRTFIKHSTGLVAPSKVDGSLLIHHVEEGGCV